jgi:glutathione reductase (NADPH)
MVAAENAVLGLTLEHRPELLPSGGFTDPDHAGVGVTERDARLQKLDSTSATANYANLDRAIIDGRKHGFVKLIADRPTGTLLGAHAIGENALELIQGLAISMSAGVTLEILASTRLSYPTYSAIVGELARRMLSRSQ